MSNTITPMHTLVIDNKTYELIDATARQNIQNKQDTLVSGTNIKTINSSSLLGSGNISVQPTLVSGTNIKSINNTSLLGSGNISVQPELVSGTNIKTINSTSLLGSGNISVQPTLVSGTNIKTINGNSVLGAGDLAIDVPAMSATTATISTTGWSENSLTVSVSGVTASNTVVVTPAPSSIDGYIASKIKCTAQAAGALTFECETIPEATLTVNVLIYG